MTELRRNREAWVRVLAIATAVASLVVSTSINAGPYRGLLIPVFAVAIIHALMLVLALFRPRVAGFLSVLASFVTIMLAHQSPNGPWPWAVTTMVTQGLIIGVIAWRSGWIPAALTLITSVLLSWLAAFLVHPPHDQETIAVNLVIFATVSGTLLASGYIWRQWQVIRFQLQSERQVSEQERSMRVIAEEKTRIARELHDVIAHSMSIINVQATSASARNHDVSEELQGEFEDIAAASRRALAEMRSLLSVLRPDNAPRELAPQPTLSRIPDLVKQSDLPGTQVTLAWTGSTGDDGVSDLSGLAAYRIVQEALANVIRHARGSSVEVRCDRGVDWIEIVVENTRPGTESPAYGGEAQPGGHGTVGMRERAASVGGTVDYGPTPSGGYRVVAHLPLSQDDEA